MKNKKKWWLIPVVLVVLVGIGVGIFSAASTSGTKPVYVYRFDMVGMTDYWGDSQSSYGPVRSDNIQTVMLSDTQTVTEIAVSQGDRVKKGDLLLSCDTTLTDLALEKKRLAVEQLKLQLQQEKDRLVEINNYQPYTPKQDTAGSVDYGSEKFGEGEICYPYTEESVLAQWLENSGYYDGKTQQSALILWIREGTRVDYSLLKKAAAFLEELRYRLAMQEYDVLLRQWQDYQQGLESGEEESENPPVKPEEPQKQTIGEYYLVIKQTAGNMTRGETTIFQGLQVSLGAESFSYLPFDPTVVGDYTRPEAPVVSAPVVDTTTYYTLAEIVQMREAQQKKILDVQYQIKIAEAEYSIAQREANDGNIYAQVDGTVVSVLTPEEAVANQQPIVKVSGGGGFYITGYIDELNREKLAIGSEVTVNDYRNGEIYTGVVDSIGDYPVSDYYSGNNLSVYNFTVVVDESADLVGGTYVDLEYTLEDSQKGIYLQNPYIREENGESYVFIQGQNGKLEKRTVVTGKSVWGSYTQIVSGITAEDKVAFPYGKNVKAGAATEDGNYDTMYE